MAKNFLFFSPPLSEVPKRFRVSTLNVVLFAKGYFWTRDARLRAAMFFVCFVVGVGETGGESG